jgi:hypothetical protein
MLRPIVRRLMAAIVLVAVLGFALPAGAADRPHSGRTPVVLGPGLLDQFLAWVGSLWLGHQPNPQSPQEKEAVGTTTGSGTTDNSSQDTLPVERGGMIDPNG